MSSRVRCRNTPKIYDVKSKDSYKICNQVVVHLLEGMCELALSDWYKFSKLRLRLNLYCMLIELNKTFKICRRNFKLYNFELEYGFCSLFCFCLFPCIPIWLGIQQKLTILPWLETVRYVLINGMNSLMEFLISLTVHINGNFTIWL